MNDIDQSDRFEVIFKYGKYLIAGIILIVAFITFLILNSDKKKYQEIENKLIEAAKNYVIKNQINTYNEVYIEVTKLGEFEGLELCKSSSGVLISNGNYQAYLNCPDYKTKILKTEGKYISLNGDDIIFISKDEIFSDPLYSMNIALLDGDVNITGEVLNNPGVYTLNYNVYYNITKKEEDFELVETLTRKVVVLEKNSDKTISGLENKEEPYLELLGDENIIVSLGSKYEEPGWKAYDYKDGKISRKVVVNGSVNTKVEGEYKLSYTIKNSKGYEVTKERKVKVVKNVADLDILISKKLENNKIILNVEIVGQGYSYYNLVGIKSENARAFSKVLDSNEEYTLKVYDIYGNLFLKKIIVDEIDDVKPTGACKAVTQYKRTSISVTSASDDKGIAGYNFKVNNKESGFIGNANYEVDESLKSASVIIKDISGNEVTINCTVEQGNDEYINEKGYNCIYPFTCFKQGDYSSERYSYCSTDTCGPINKRGCSITSVTTIISGFGVKDKNGEVYTPYTLLTDIYKNVCSSYCSGNTTSKKVFEHELIGLKVYGEKYYAVNRINMEILKNHLKTGGAALLRVGPGWYTNGGHLMAILAINEKDEVYLYDPGSKRGQSNGRHAVNAFVPTDDLISGGATWFQLVGKK